MLRSDAADFARTCRAWLVAPADAPSARPTAVVGEPRSVRRFRRYLAASEVQFRTGTITNYRLVLHRRPDVCAVRTATRVTRLHRLGTRSVRVRS